MKEKKNAEQKVSEKEFICDEEDVLFLLQTYAATFKENPDLQDLKAKALAYYLFREIMEDVHAKYKISDDEMKEMNIKAANRAKLFLEGIMNDKWLTLAFTIEASMCTGWNRAEISESEIKDFELFSSLAKRCLHMMAFFRADQIGAVSDVFKILFNWI